MTERLGTIEKTVGIIVTVLAAYTAFQTGQVGNKVSALETRIKQNEDQRAERKLNQDITKEIFGEFTKCFTDENQSADARILRLSGVSALIEALPDPAVKTKLLTAVDAAMRRTAETRSFRSRRSGSYRIGTTERP